MEEKINGLCARIKNYTQQKQLGSAGRALEFIAGQKDAAVSGGEAENFLTELVHWMEVCLMLIDLRPEISLQEEDSLLSAVLLKACAGNIERADIKETVSGRLGFSDKTADIICAITPERDFSERELKLSYENIEKDKLTLLAALADRGILVQRLYEFSTWNAHRYIEETKACYYPMCIYGKEHYHELLGPISVLMEKMKSLIEVSEILLKRYELREAELIQDILALKEENATIKGIIAKFRA